LASISSADPVLAELVAQITDRINAGEPVDVSAYAARCPGSEGRLRELLEAMCLLDRSGATVPAAGPECTLGDYRLIREVGRGGMGIVYEAEQISLSRRVALKVLPFAATMDPRHLQRFHNEARAAASLHHPNIVAVHGVGCERGVHFYAMQFIDGPTLAEVIQNLTSRPTSRSGKGEASHNGEGEQAGSPLRFGEGRGEGFASTAIAALSTQRTTHPAEFYRRVAELGVQAAEALEYAHTMGIVHRDVKPANLMLDSSSPRPSGGEGSGVRGAPRLWITDFGLAKHGDASLTMSGDLLGTLRYVSPEQALARHGLVDHRTDIYSLGATLYELLLGRPAVVGEDKQEILRQLAFEEPTAPHKLDAKLPRDLETVLLKCLDKTPDLRYASAQDLADDLKRWLAHKPVQAKPPTLRTRAGKWVQRNRPVVATAMIIAVTLLAGTAVSVWQAVEATNARELADNRRKDAEAESSRASEAEKRATTEAAIARAVNEFLQGDLIGQAASAPLTNLEIGGDPYLTVKEALDRAAASIGNRFQDQPLVEASIRHSIGSAYVNLHENQLALPHLERAVALREGILGREHADTLASMSQLASACYWNVRYTDLITLREHILKITSARLGPDHAETLGCVRNLAYACFGAGRSDASRQLLEELLEKRRAALGPMHPDVLDIMHGLAMTYEDLGRLDDAIALLEGILRRRRDAQSLWTMDVLAQVYQRVGKLEESERLLIELLELCRTTPDSRGRRVTEANARGWLARTLMLQRRFAEAEPHVRHAVEVMGKYPSNVPRYFFFVSLLGEVLMGLQKFTEAEPFLLQGYEGAKQWRALGPARAPRRLSEACERLVRYYEVTKQPDKARAWREELATHQAPE
jgi:serine/threonine protein kinase/tetratricopeptide (TPR) repeat protein